MSIESRPASGKLDAWFAISARGSSVRQEILAGLTTFLAMVYSVIVVPGMLGKAGFPPTAVFVATCLMASFGSILMGLLFTLISVTGIRAWILRNLPMGVAHGIGIGLFLLLIAADSVGLVVKNPVPGLPVALG